MKFLAILFTVLLTISVLTSEAQKFKAGMTCGVNVSAWTKDGDKFGKDLADEMNRNEGFSGFSSENGKRTAFDVGLFALIKKNNNLYFQPELIYVQKGAKFNLDGTFTYEWNDYDVNEIMTIQCDYLDINLLGKYYLGKKLVKFYLMGGPGAGLLVKSKMKVKATIDGESDTKTQDFDQFKSTDAHLNFAAGLEYLESISMECRLQQGFIPILDSTEEYKLTNFGIMININVIF